MEDEKLPFTEHLEELRKRILYCLAAVAIGFILSYNFAEQLFLVLAHPLRVYLPKDSSFIFTGLAEGFVTYLKLAFFAGIFLAVPVILYQIWCFVAPGLYSHERQYALPFILLSTIFFLVGALFCYFVVLPIGCKFFLSYNTDYIRLLPSMKEYLSFSCAFILAFGIIFELPLFILLLARIGIVHERQLRASRRYVIVLIFIVAAILTPPDVISQICMAIPLLVLYELSILLAKLFGKKREPEPNPD